MLALQPGPDVIVRAGQREGLFFRGSALDVQTPAHLAVDLDDQGDAGRRREIRIEFRPGRLEQQALFPEARPQLVGDVRSDRMEELDERLRGGANGCGW